MLRLEDTYGAKIRPPLHVYLNNSVIRPSFKNLRDNCFDQVAKDAICMFTFEKCPPVSELKLTVSKNQQIRPF